MNDKRADIYSRITNQIIAAIEAGTGEFRMPWHHDCSATTRPVNVMSGKRYRGVNVLVLWSAAEQAGYDSGVWGTYRQWAAKGGQVEFRAEKAGLIHAGVGKASFSEKALVENVKAFVTASNKAKPSGSKGTYLKKVSIASTMGPGVKLDVSSLVG